jgi:DNA-binding beta-propeller fold protein YncE
MSYFRKYLVAPMALVATIVMADAAAAQSLVALVGDKTIAMISPKNWKVTATKEIKGAGKIVGIDVRPADNMLYALNADGWLFTVDPKTGAATKKVELSSKLPAGVSASVDFNPVADRMRVIGSDGTSLRVNVDDGKTIVDGSLKYAESDANKGKTPRVIAAAYSNSVKGTKETTLYDIDAATGSFARQVPPNDGVLNTIGSLGVKIQGPVAFNIVAGPEGGNAGWLVADGKLHSVDMKTGAAKSVGMISGLKGTITDIAWWEENPKSM